jgi:hypothetical protein
MSHKPLAEAELLSLVKEFRFPLDDVTPEEIESKEAVAAVLNEIQRSLSKSSSWTVRLDSLKRILALLKGGIHYYPGGDLSSLAPQLALAIADLRGVLVKGSAIAVSAAAITLREAFVTSIATIVPALLKQLCAANPQISNCAHLALLAIIKNCQHQNVAQTVLALTNSPSAQYRQIAAEATHIITETWNAQLFVQAGGKKTPGSFQLSSELAASIETLGNDSVAEIREVAEAAANLPPQAKPKSRRIPPSTLPYSEPVPKQMKPAAVSPSRSFSRISERSPAERGDSPRDISATGTPRTARTADLALRDEGELTLVDLMPPSSLEQAVEFRAQILDLAKSGGSLPDDDGPRLVLSIIRAVGFIPERNAWQGVLRALFKAFPGALQSDPVGLLRAFAYEPWVFETFAKRISMQELAESFVLITPLSLRTAHDFFNQLLQIESIKIDITPKVKETLQALVRRYRPGHPNALFVKVLNSSSRLNEFELMLNTLKTELTEDSGPSSQGKALLDGIVAIVEQEDGPFVTKLQENFDLTLPPLISSGTLWQQQTVLGFITAAAPRLKQISFLSSIDALLRVIQATPDLTDLAIACLTRTLSDVKVLKTLTAFLANTPKVESFCLKALLEYVLIAPPQRLLVVRKTIFAELNPFLNSETPEVRRMVIPIFAQLKIKIPREVESQIRKLGPGQRRLVELSAAKAVAAHRPAE